VVVGTVVITIIGAVGSLSSEAFGDFSVADFVGLNLVFGSMVLVSPLVYSALRTKVPKDEEHEKTTIAGTVVGLLVGAAAILWAAFGQLASLFILVLAAPHEWLEFVLEVFLILLAAGFVFIYAWKTLGWTVNGYAELTAEDEKAPKTVPELQRAAVEQPELTPI
jgi:MFS family permease